MIPVCEPSLGAEEFADDRRATVGGVTRLDGFAENRLRGF